ncbi:MAG: S1 RNA-binding domain-containing protein, partial [Gammaproteobacteria bacterium]|nr:S1 RNA-binding domain-containing protein [Gammaproteobacteria bacterium]
MRKILINVLPAREVRVAVVTTNEGSSPTVLHDLHIEHSNNRPVQGNIYKARVCAVKDELNAAFVDYGDVKQGLLALSRIEPLSRPTTSTESSSSARRISDYVKVGDDVLVQIDKDPRADKGASLTTRIQLHGQHIVFTTNRPRNRISRMISGAEREEMSRILSKVKLPKDSGLVIRTSAGGKNTKTLQQDVNECIQLLDLINQAYKQSEAPRLLYEENNMINTVLRDNLHAQIEEILVDDAEVYQQTVDFVNNFMPDFEGKIVFYENALPLFTRNKIEKQSNR